MNTYIYNADKVKVSNLNVNKVKRWEHNKRGIKTESLLDLIAEKEEKWAKIRNPNYGKTFKVKYLSKRKKFTSPKGGLQLTFEGVKQMARLAGYAFVQMGVAKSVV